MRTSIQRFIILLVLALYPVLIFLSFWLNDRSMEIEGPSKIRLGQDGYVYILINKTIAKLSTKGEFIDFRDLNDVGFAGEIVDFIVRGDGNMVVGAEDASIGIYSWSGGRIDDYPVKATNAPEGYPAYFRLAESPDGNIYLSDPYQDSVVVYDPNVREAINLRSPLGEESVWNAQDRDEGRGIPATPFDWVNGIKYHDELLYVADSNNHRVVVLNKDGSFQRIYPSSDTKTAYKNPKSISVYGNHLVSVNVSTQHPGGDVVAIDLNSGQRRKFQDNSATMRRLLEGSYFAPEDILALKGKVLVADRDNMIVYRFGWSGSYEGLFGDDAFKGLVEKAVFHKRAYLYARYASILIMVFLLFGLLVFAERCKKQKKATIDEAALSPQQGHALNEGEGLYSDDDLSVLQGSDAREHRIPGLIRGILPFIMYFFTGNNARGAITLFLFIVFSVLGVMRVISLAERDFFITPSMTRGIGFMVFLWVFAFVDANVKYFPEKYHPVSSREKTYLLGLSLFPFFFALVGVSLHEALSALAPDTLYSARALIWDIIVNYGVGDPANREIQSVEFVRMFFGWAPGIGGLLLSLALLYKEKGWGVIYFLIGLLLGAMAMSTHVIMTYTVSPGIFIGAERVVFSLFIGGVSYVLFRSKGMSIVVIVAALAGTWLGDMFDLFGSLFFVMSYSSLINIKAYMILWAIKQTLIPIFFISFAIIWVGRSLKPK